MELLAVVPLVLYFVPSVVAAARKAKATAPVVVINVLLGWTVLGWVVALAMAFGEKKPSSVSWALTSMQTPPMPAGWYPSPHEPGFVRWWDGDRWLTGENARRAATSTSDR